MQSTEETRGSCSKVASAEQKKNFLKSPFSRRKKTESARSSPVTPLSENVKGKTVSTSNNNNRCLTKTTNPGYRPIGRTRKGSSSSSSSSACGFQYTPRDATRTGGIQRRPNGSLMYTAQKSGPPASVSSVPVSSRGKRDSKPLSGSRIPAYSSARGKKASSGSESEPGVALELSDSDEKLSEYRAKAIRGGGGKVPPNRGQHQILLAQNASTLPTSGIQSMINRDSVTNATKGKSNSLPNAQTQRLKYQETNTVLAKRQSGETKVPSPINTRLPVKSGEPAPKSPDTVSVKSSSSQKSHKSTTSGSQRSSTGSVQSVINLDRARSTSPHKSMSGSAYSINSQRKSTVTNSAEDSKHQQGSPKRHSNYIECNTEGKRTHRISLVEYENPPVTLEYRTIIRSGGGGFESSSKRKSSNGSPTAVAVAAASCQTDENVTGLGLRGEDLAEINTDTQQLEATLSEVSHFFTST